MRRHLPPALRAPSGSIVQFCDADALQRRSVATPDGPPAGVSVLAQYPAISEVSAPAGSVHCWLLLGVVELPVLFDVAWQTAATAREPFLLPADHGQFLHLGLSLSWTMESPPDGLGAAPGTQFTLNETRRVRFYERNYYDHPAFGVITLVTPAQGPRAPGR